jgi:peptidoglycan L-alanyl-D-glutamate endopeptidase CwlK
VYKFGQRSLERLSTCTPEVQHLMGEVIKEVDCTILCGFRGKEDQDEVVRLGRSKKPWPTSKHNQNPSPAVDVVPYPVDWTDLSRFARFAGRVESVAHRLGYVVVWGGDWDNDTFTKDESFVDMPHFEVYKRSTTNVENT